MIWYYSKVNKKQICVEQIAVWKRVNIFYSYLQYITREKSRKKNEENSAEKKNKQEK